MKNIKSKFIDKDGKLNGKMLAGLISLLIVLVQQIFASFGVKPANDLSGIVAVINTILAILGLIGVMSEPATVSVDTSALETSVTNAISAASVAKSQAVVAQQQLQSVKSQVNATVQQVANLNAVVSDKIATSK